MKTPYKKWRNEHVIFLDDAFDCVEVHDLLVAEGFSVERFTKAFATPHGTREQSVKDPTVIRHCNSKAYILLTTDGDIINRHRRVIETCTYLGILATAHNTVEDIGVWVRAFIKLKPLIEKNNFRKRKRPWFGRFDKEGKISTPIRYLGIGPESRPPEKSHSVRSLNVNDAKAIGSS